MTNAALFNQLQETLEYIVGHASMARHHANQRGWIASLQNVEKAAREGIALLKKSNRSGNNDLIAVAQLALDYLDGQEYLQASAIIARAQNE